MAKRLSTTLTTLSVNTLAVANGGTNVATIPVNCVVLGNGTNAIQTVAPGATGNVLTSNGTTWVSSPAPISLPTQTGNTGKFLTTDGSTASWVTQTLTLPTQTSNAGKYLTTDGTTASWGIVSGSGGSSGLTVTPVKTSAYTASDNELVRCNTAAGAFNITFPAAPVDGAIIGVIDINNTFNINAITLLSNSKTIEGDVDGIRLDISGTYASFVYTSTTSNWRLLETPSTGAITTTGSGSISILTRSASSVSVVVSAGLLPILTSKAYGTICVLAAGGLPIYTNNLTTTQVGVN